MFTFTAPRRPSLWWAAVLCIPFANPVAGDEPGRVMPPGQRPPDRRLTDPPRNLDGYFPFDPPTQLAAWERRRHELRTQLQVALGLWPMPERSPLQPVIHGRIDRDDYTIEKVYFASLPGHYVTGNLYRPKRSGPARAPAVLCPHGHWANGRMYDAGETAARKEIASGGETWLESARYILQAKCAGLARLGCVVFHFDMLGYADSMAIPHREGFSDVGAVLRLQSQMGLQTWNCLRALDFVSALPDVDPQRIGVTGGSGGGTQSFILTAIDDRIAASFPAVMVSTAMQGGCICENAPYLRIGTGNVEIAALCAPRPLGMTGANDWTREIESKGLPELKAVYRLYGADDNVMAWCFPQFGHNYNQVARETMSNWFNLHLRLRRSPPIRERPFVPVPPKELSVFDAAHPRPTDERNAEGIKRVLTAQSDQQLQALQPTTPQRAAEFRRVVGAALRVMLGGGLSAADSVELKPLGSPETTGGIPVEKLLLGRAGDAVAIPALLVRPTASAKPIVVWLHPAGKASLFESDGSWTAAARAIAASGAGILAVDVLGVGELGGDRPKVDARYAGYTFGYNPPLVAERVRDVLTAVAAARRVSGRRPGLVGWESAGPWAVLARAVAGDAVSRCAADLVGFRFDAIQSFDDPMMLSGAVKYGGLGAFAALSAPHPLLLYNHRGTGTGRWIAASYESAGAMGQLVREPESVPPAAVIDWLLK